VFVHLFGLVDSEIAAGADFCEDSRRRVLLGARGTLARARANEVFARVLPDWHSTRTADGFIGEIVPETERPITFSYKLKVSHDFDHSKCSKCSIVHSIAGALSLSSLSNRRYFDWRCPD